MVLGEIAEPVADDPDAPHIPFEGAVVGVAPLKKH